MKRLLFVIAVCSAFLAATALLGKWIDKEESGSEETAAEVAGRKYVWEKGGFGSDFVITFHDDGTYDYYEGVLSSYLGKGEYRIEQDILIMRDMFYDLSFSFRVTESGLIYLADQSSSFLYAHVNDGDRFYVLTNSEE